MEDFRDEWGNDCAMYTDYPGTCGAGDTDDFIAEELCCACGGGSTRDQQTCENTNDEALDSDGFGCNYYNNDPLSCGLYDTADFLSEDMCCGCGGGRRNDFDPETAEVSTVGEILENADNVADVALAIIHNPGAVINSVFGFGEEEVVDEDIVQQREE